MNLAIMQPYFFPYIGYWQLIHAVDRFVIYDDVNYIKQGWINRNRILINGDSVYITVPLERSSSYKKISETNLLQSSVWRDKLVNTIEITYRKAPSFYEVFPIVEKIIRYETDNLSTYLANQLQALSSYIGISTEFVVSSRCYENNQLGGQERILDICKREKATTYINAQGGRELYDTRIFNDAGIELRFIASKLTSYRQRVNGFIPQLSIIDILMEIGPVAIKNHLDAFDLITKK